MTRHALLKDQRGQIFMGYVVAMMIVLAVMVTVTRYVQSTRTNVEKRIYQEEALMVARMGFEEGLSFFRRAPSGVYLEQSDAAVDQGALSWKMHPDAAFMPMAGDTDHYSSLTLSASTVDGALYPAPITFTARGIVRTFPLLTTSGLTNTAELYKSPLWGRFVIKRQNFRNWSPGPNTYSAFTDPEAAHDLTQFRNKVRPGSGNIWSLVSKGYVFSNPANVTYSAWFASAALHEKGDLLNAPVAKYQGKPFLLARASVYGELYRLSFNDQTAALWVNNANNVVLRENAVISGGGSASAIARVSGSFVDSSLTYTAGSPIVTGNPLYVTSVVPNIGAVFPGLDEAMLKNMADKVHGVAGFPNFNDPQLADMTSPVTFIWVSTTMTAGTATFPAGTTSKVMTGNGLVFVKGHLVIEKGNFSGWRGIVFVDGNVTLRGPATISGTLIATGTVTLGNLLDNTQTRVEYNDAALATVKDYLQDFDVLKTSVVATTK